MQGSSDDPEQSAGQEHLEMLTEEDIKEQEKMAIKEKEKQQAIEDLNRVNAVRQKTKEDALKKLEEERRKAEEARKMDEELLLQAKEKEKKPKPAEQRGSNQPAQAQGQTDSAANQLVQEYVQQAT